MSRYFFALLATMVFAHMALAHFPWLYVTDSAEPRLYFGEGLDSRDYHLPEAVEAAEVWQDAIDAPAKRLTMETLEEDGFTGMEADSPIEPRGVLRTRVEYGLYHGSKLTYYAQHFPAENPRAWPTQATTEGGFAATLAVEGDRLEVVVLRDGLPLAGARATLTSEEDAEGVSETTDQSGVARFPLDSVHSGLNGVMVMHVDKEAKGEVDGESFTSATQILTATFNYDPEEAAKVSALPRVPEAVASFGAVVVGDWLYVYGGHIGQAHDHSRDNLSKHFRRIRLDGSGAWEDLPMGTALQGLPLVAHGGKVYRVGGLDARNASGDEEQLHSVDQFACYDPATGSWADLAPLPGPRSSHNAVVVGDRLFVVGGWALSGDDDGEWQLGALVYDFKDPEAGWATLPEPPFKRRALAISHADGRVAVLCGMTDDADISKQVFFYHPTERSWEEGPEFPGMPFFGFGLSAWNLDGKLYAGGMEGVLYRLDNQRTKWTKVDRFATKRFFHQLVPDGAGGLLAVAGASPEVGHTGTIERLDLESEAEEAGDDSATPSQNEAADSKESTPAIDNAATLTPSASPPDRWPGFRGAGASVTSAENLPTNWSEEQGVAWRKELPGYGQSSPVVWGESVFVTTMQGEQKETPTVLCFDLESGEERWRREYESSQLVEASNYVSRSAPTPCVDADRVYAFFESGDLFSLTHEGEPVWRRSLVDEFGEIEGPHGIGGSPLLVGEKLVVAMLHAGPSYLLAVDHATGETEWKTDFLSRVAWSSPALAKGSIVLSGAGLVAGYDVLDGSEQWRVEGLEGNNVPSPTVVDDVVVIGSQQRSHNLALQLRGDAGAAVRWRADKATSSFASPLVDRGLVYLVSKAGVAQCLELATGQLVWKQRLKESCWASPLLSGERVYFLGKQGETAVYAAGREKRLIAENSLPVNDGSRVYGVAAVDRRLLIRTGQELICLE